MTKKVMTHEEIIAAIREMGGVLGRTPTLREFIKKYQIPAKAIWRECENWTQGVVEAGLVPYCNRIKRDERDLFMDWAGVARKLGKIPTRWQYEHKGQFGSKRLTRDGHKWTQIPDRFREFAGDRAEFADVVALLSSDRAMPVRRVRQPISYAADPLSVAFSAGGGKSDHVKLPDRPVYGMPIDFRGLRHAPANEQGVVFLFGMVARELGYIVESIQTGFPDCDAKRRIGVDTWQRVRIEFEYESKHYLTHGHPLDGCDVIVCWRDNWGEKPEGMECVELISAIRELNANGR